MKWIVGLGNPGKQYAHTRHNIGFMAVDQMAEDWRLTWKLEARHRAVLADGRINGQRALLIKPMTYMNLSGESVRSVMEYYKLDLANMVVVYDDLDTEFGAIRLRYKGSAGGHNGIKSIIQHAGTQEFQRIRMGISRPPAHMAVVDYVLSDFPNSGAAVLQQVTETTCRALEEIMEKPFDQVMGKFNALPPSI